MVKQKIDFIIVWSSFIMLMTIVLLIMFFSMKINTSKFDNLSFVLLYAYFGAIIGYFIAKYLSQMNKRLY